MKFYHVIVRGKAIMFCEDYLRTQEPNDTVVAFSTSCTRAFAWYMEAERERASTLAWAKTYNNPPKTQAKKRPPTKTRKSERTA